ncbi:MAG: hypothetical protein OI715_00580 (plasmid) [Candidatus Methanoperedens sp.]|nr:MAG: hypothetical protein OI715_00580 [Candidatus Methanoperedens sp.]
MIRNDIKNKIDLVSGTAYLLKFASALFITFACIVILFILGAIMSIQNGSIKTPEFPEVFILGLTIFGIVVLSNSVWDILALSSSIHAALTYDSIKSMVMTKSLVLLIVIAGIGYIPLSHYFFPGYENLAGIVWMIHAGIVLFFTKYTEILSIQFHDPFTTICKSIRMIKNNFLESLVIALLEIALVLGIFALIMQILNVCSAVIITSLAYLLIFKPTLLKTSIQIAAGIK